MQAGSIAGTIQSTEMFLLLGGGLLFVYWWFSSDSTQSIRDALSNLAPDGVTPVAPPAPGTERATGTGKIGTTSDGNTQYHVSRSGAISVLINGSVQDFGPNAEVPGTGLTVSDYRSQGYSDGDIAYLLDQSQVSYP